MILRGIDFGPVWGASGVQGFFGEGYKYHGILQILFPTRFFFEGMTFVAKTTTLHPREGNMPLRGDRITPREWKPRCIHLTRNMWRKGIALNAVGLSGPGAEFLLKTGKWQARRNPFFLSFMAVGATREARLEEMRGFVRLLKSYLSQFKAPVGLQLNLSCPNVGIHVDALIEEAHELLSEASKLKIPLVVKLNVLVSVKVACVIASHSACNALSVSNTIPWGALPHRINWKNLFGTETSPLAHLGGGGLSGAPLLPLVAEWVSEARCVGLTKPINAGGGILSPSGVSTLFHAGASSVAIGSLVMLRPWQLQPVIRRAWIEHKEISRRANEQTAYSCA